MNKKLKIGLIVLILLFAFFIRIFPIRYAHFWDETVYLQHAEMMFSGRNNFSELSFRPPLLSIIFFLSFFIKHSVITASIVTAAIGSLAALFIYLIGKKLYNEKIGLVAGLIFIVVPFLTLNCNYLLTDIPVVTFMAISFYLALFRYNKLLLFSSGILLGLAVLMKFTAILMVFVFLFYFYLRKIKIKKILTFFLGFALIMIPYFIWCYFSFGDFILPFIKGRTMVTDKNEPTLFYLFNLSKAFSYLTVLGLFLWVVEIICSRKKDYTDWKKDLIMVFWISVFFAYMTKTPHKELRYILPITVPILLLAARGLISFCGVFKRQIKYVLIFFFVLLLLYLASSTYSWKSIEKRQFIDWTLTDEMKIGEYLNNEMNYTGIIYSNERWPVLAYYTGLETRFLEPYDSLFYEKYREIMQEKGLLIGMFDVKQPQPIWLDKNDHFEHIIDIGEFFIYSYKP